VLPLTDGLANQGITDHGTLVDMARTTAADGVGTTTIGLGEGFDEELLTDMADAGQGNSYYVASPEDAPGVFAQEFEDLSALVPQNVSVEIRPSEEVKLLGVLNEYPATSVQGGLHLNLGDAYGEDLRRIVFELHIPQLARLGLAKVADVVVRYATVGDEVAAREITIPVNINMVNADEASTADPDRQVIEEGPPPERSDLRMVPCHPNSALDRSRLQEILQSQVVVTELSLCLSSDERFRQLEEASRLAFGHHLDARCAIHGFERVADRERDRSRHRSEVGPLVWLEGGDLNAGLEATTEKLANIRQLGSLRHRAWRVLPSFQDH